MSKPANMIAPEPVADADLDVHARHHLAQAQSFFLTRAAEVDAGRIGGRVYGAALDRYIASAHLGLLLYALAKGVDPRVAANLTQTLMMDGDPEHAYLALESLGINPDDVQAATLERAL